MRRKILILFLFMFLGRLNLLLGNDLINFEPDCSATNLDNTISILGINEETHILSYIASRVGAGRGDIRYSYIIYDYMNNIILENLQKKWIAQNIYNENGILDWKDNKYSVDSYKLYIKDTIEQVDTQYNLKSFDYKDEIILNYQIVLKNRKPISNITEDICYDLIFNYDNKKYLYQEKYIKTNTIKNITELTIYDINNFLLCIQKIARKEIEDNDYYEYIIRGIKK